MGRVGDKGVPRQLAPLARYETPLSIRTPVQTHRCCTGAKPLSAWLEQGKARIVPATSRPADNAPRRPGDPRKPIPALSWGVPDAIALSFGAAQQAAENSPVAGDRGRHGTNAA